MKDLFDVLDDGEREALEDREVPEWTAPMLATLVHETFSDPEWIYERKLDGERCLAFRGGEGGEGVRLLSRNEKELNRNYPEIVEALEDQELDRFVVDGEVVAFEGDVTSFSKLQPRMHLKSDQDPRESGVTVYYYLFDALHLAGKDLTGLPLRRRKQLLRRAFRFEDPLRFTRHRNEDGEEYHREACRKGWEGIIAKDAGAEYVHSRSKKWLKFKCAHQQELVIGGYTDPEGSRERFGALLLGFYDGDDLRYAGKVGTGFDDETLQDLGDRLEELERKTPPYAEADRDELPSSGVHWVTPELVAEIAFTEWTGDDRLRHPRYLGLRRDKAAEEVVKEG